MVRAKAKDNQAVEDVTLILADAIKVDPEKVKVAVEVKALGVRNDLITAAL